MKSIVLTLFLLLSAYFVSYSQCIPYPFPGPALINPDTSVGLPPSVETEPYSQVVHIRIPEDTLFNGLIIPIDSAGIKNVTGMPTSMSYVSNSPNDFWPGNSFGYVVIQGTPLVGEAGFYAVEIEVETHAFGMTMSFFFEYDFEILDSTHLSIVPKPRSDFYVFQNQPNPFVLQTTIEFSAPTRKMYQMQIFNVMGQKVYHQNIEARKGLNQVKLERNQFEAGIYIYEISDGLQKMQRKMIVN